MRIKVAFGLKAHSGWAALVVLGARDDEFVVFDRRRLELVNSNEAAWAKQPYHAADGLRSPEARRLVERALKSAQQNAFQAMKASIARAQELGLDVRACGVLMGEPMPEWTVDEILAVHFRMHKAEGVMFREALAKAASQCEVKLVAVREKELTDHAERVLQLPWVKLQEQISTLGKTVGPPWGKDQKEAALTAMIALRSARRTSKGG